MTQQASPFELILDDCVTAVLTQGTQAHPVTACLQQYPGERDALEPLLHLVLRLQKAQAIRPDPAFRHVAATRMQNLIAARPRPTQSVPQPEPPAVTIWQQLGSFFPHQRPFAWARILAVVFLLWLGLGSITVWAAQEALPGERLYSVKQLVENTQVRLTVTAARQARLQLTLAERRLQETAVLLSRNHVTEIDQTVAAYRAAVETAAAFLNSSSQLTAQEKEAFAQLLSQTLAGHETQLAAWQDEQTVVQAAVDQALQAAQEAHSLATSLLGEVPASVPIVPVINTAVPPPSSTAAPTPSATATSTPSWVLPPFWPQGCPSPLDWPDTWPESCPLLDPWPPDWPEPPCGWPIPPLPSGTPQPPAGWTPPPANWPDLATAIPIPTLVVPPEWPTECPLPPEWPDSWEDWPEDCEIPTDFEWPEAWPALPPDCQLPEAWPEMPSPTEAWADSPEELPPPPTGFPELPDALPPPEAWPTPPAANDDEPFPWPWP